MNAPIKSIPRDICEEDCKYCRGTGIYSHLRRVTDYKGEIVTVPYFGPCPRLLPPVDKIELPDLPEQYWEKL